MQLRDNLVAFLKQQPRWRLIVAGMVILFAVLRLFKGGGGDAGKGVAFSTSRGPLDITVLEGGSVQALESQEIKCEARVGYNGIKILKIVEEGYQVTEEDVRTNRILVELDSSELQKQLVQQEIQYQSAAATLTEAQQGYEIQLNQNLSDIKAAEQKARFALMDFEKYLGGRAAQEIIGKAGIEMELAAEQTNTVDKAGGNATAAVRGESAAPKTEASPAGTNLLTFAPANSDSPRATVPPPPAADPPGQLVGVSNSPASTTPTSETPAVSAAAPAPQPSVIDFSRYADINVLGDGEAKQKLRELEDTFQVAMKEAGQAQSLLAGTQRLFEKGFVPKTELERDEIAAENARLKVQKGETARALFLQYEFPKAAEEWLSKYSETKRELSRARKAAVSKLAQAEARWRSAQAQFTVQESQLRDFRDQVKKCVIPATKTGLVVYGGGGDEMFYYGDQERIREGGTVRERQSILTIPDMTKMGVKVKIPESYIKQVKKGQKVRISVDAFPDQRLTGEVTKVGVLPDSQNRWMSPDIKVYLTTISINGTYDWLKPGMTTKVEIMVDRLPEVLYVPVTAVTPLDGKQVCHVVSGGSVKPREVEIGQFNDVFIEIKKGLKEGERVLLRPPEAPTQENDGKQKNPGTDKPGSPTPSASPAGAKA